MSALKSADLDEYRAAIDRFADRVEFVTVEPCPPVISRPIMDADDTKQERRCELHARLAGHADDFAGPGYQPDSLAVGQ